VNIVTATLPARSHCSSPGNPEEHANVDFDSLVKPW
jgi:hypothetical protein